MTKKKDKLVRLDIACGQNLTEGFIGMDIHPGKGVKYVGDIFDFWSDESPWKQIPDNSVDEIVANMILEHVPHIIEGHGMKHGFDDCFYLFFDEIYRILKPATFAENNPGIPISGFAKFITPYYSSIRCWQDPTHARAISEASFLYLNAKWREMNKLDHYPIKANFEYFYAYNYDGILINRNEDFRANAVKKENNSVSDLITTIYKR
jgi:hypothetical protein